jgi:hypothetical protein
MRVTGGANEGATTGRAGEVDDLEIVKNIGDYLSYHESRTIKVFLGITRI